MEKIRLDVLIEKKGLAHSRSLAQRLVMEGAVRVNGQVALKPSMQVNPTDKIEIEEPPRFVSRGGEKLLAAIEAFGLVDLEGRICVDLGARIIIKKKTTHRAVWRICVTPDGRKDRSWRWGCSAARQPGREGPARAQR
mgnify:CR=1 FL=1